MYIYIYLCTCVYILETSHSAERGVTIFRLSARPFALSERTGAWGAATPQFFTLLLATVQSACVGGGLAPRGAAERKTKKKKEKEKQNKLKLLFLLPVAVASVSSVSFAGSWRPPRRDDFPDENLIVAFNNLDPRFRSNLKPQSRSAAG